MRDAGGRLSREAVSSLLPYGNGFLFVDSVTQLGGQEIVAHYQVTSFSPLIEEHLPHAPTMPSALVGEALAQAGMLLLRYELEVDDQLDMVVTAVHKVRYRSLVVPGDALTQHVRILASSKTGARLEGDSYVEERRICQAAFDVRLVARRRLASYAAQLQAARGHSVDARGAGFISSSSPESASRKPRRPARALDDGDTEAPVIAPRLEGPQSLLPAGARSKPRLLGGLLLLVVGAVAATGFAVYEEPPRELPAVRVERADLDQVIRVTGEVINDRTVLLTALVDGQIAEIHVSRGEHVKAGQVLASMDNRAAAARQARASAKVRQAAVGVREQRQRLDRLKRLGPRGGVSEEALDKAELEVEAAVAAWNVAQAEAEATVVEQEWQSVRAPFDAVVVDKSTEAGQWVEAGTKLFKLVALAGWEIEANLDAVDSGHVRVGQSVQVRCDAFPDQVWATRLHWIGPVVERKTERTLNTFPVRMGLGEKAPPLLLGQQIDVEILLEHRAQALQLPFSALRERDGGGFEVALLEQGRVQYRPVETGLETETRVELLGGLGDGQRVIRLDGATIKPGAAGHFAEADDPD